MRRVLGSVSERWTRVLLRIGAQESASTYEIMAFCITEGTIMTMESLQASSAHLTADKRRVDGINWPLGHSGRNYPLEALTGRPFPCAVRVRVERA
jgi:hypothetical protein